MSCHHPGVIVEDGAKDSFFGAFGMIDGFYGGAVHEVTDPKVVDIVHFISLSHIGACLDCQEPLLFDNTKQGVVMHGRVSEETLVPEIFVEFLNGPVGVGFALDLDGFHGLLVKAFGPAVVGAFLGFEGVKTILAVSPEPGLHGGDAEFLSAIAREVVFEPGLVPEVLILSS